MSNKPRSKDMPCECRQGIFDCESRVRAYLAGDSTAGHELGSKYVGLMQAIVAKRIYDTHRQDQDDCFEALVLKVFGQKERDQRWRLQDWINRTDRGPFCRWIVAVAIRHVIDWNRKKPSRHLNLLGNDDAVAPSVAGQFDSSIMKLIGGFVGESMPQVQRLYKLKAEQNLEWSDIAVELGVHWKTAYNWWKEFQRGLLRTLMQQGFEDILLPSVRAALKVPIVAKLDRPKDDLVDDVDDSHNVVTS